jgi:hypothetical protein
MSFKVCKTVDVTENTQYCTGTKEFRNCNFGVKTTPEEVCGEGDNYELAVKDLETELHDLLYGRCQRVIKCEVSPAQSATDMGPSFWERVAEWFSAVSVNCGGNEPIGW